MQQPSEIYFRLKTERNIDAITSILFSAELLFLVLLYCSNQCSFRMMSSHMSFLVVFLQFIMPLRSIRLRNNSLLILICSRHYPGAITSIFTVPYGFASALCSQASVTPR